VILANPLVSARVARHLAEFFSGPVFGSSAMARRPFQAAVTDLANRFIFPLPAEPESLERFSERFRSITGHSADFAAAQTYDAVQLLGGAIRQAGANRARVGDALRAASPWSGAAGGIRWDMTGQNTRPVPIVQLERSRITCDQR
jgi:ABC-type branched-subunit amino acid transport system substrate-binding protein